MEKEANKKVDETKAKDKKVVESKKNQMQNDTQKEEAKVKIVTKKKNKHLIILGVLFVVLALVCAGTYYYVASTNPTTVYQNIVKESLGNIIKFTNSTMNEHDKTNLHLELRGTTDNMENKTVVDLVDNVRLKLDLQTDVKEKQAVLKLESTYNNESLLNGNIYLDANTNKMHFYAKDIMDKYIEVDIEKYLKKAETIIGESNKVVLKDHRTALKILENKVDTLITETMCTKEDNAYVLKTTEVEIAQKAQGILQELKQDETFLNCFEDKELVKEKIEEILKEADLENVGTDVYEIRIYTKGFIPTLDRIEITQIAEETNRKISCYIHENSVQIFVVENNEQEVNIFMDCSNTSDDAVFSIVLSFKDGGIISIYGAGDYYEIDELEKIDTSKVKSFDDLTLFERMSLLFNIKNPNVYKLLLPLLITGAQ